MKVEELKKILNKFPELMEVKFQGSGYSVKIEKVVERLDRASKKLICVIE